MLFKYKKKIFYKENKQFLLDIKLKEEVKEIIYKKFIPVSIKLSWNEEDNGTFEIEPADFKIEDKNNQNKINIVNILNIYS